MLPRQLNGGNGGLESETSIVNSRVTGVDSGCSGDEREEIGGHEIEKFEVEDREGVRA